MNITVPLKYFRKFWKFLEMPLNNYKIYLESNWSKDCVSSTIADTIVTLSCKDNVKQV